jgi:hypothetical protein
MVKHPWMYLPGDGQWLSCALAAIQQWMANRMMIDFHYWPTPQRIDNYHHA